MGRRKSETLANNSMKDPGEIYLSAIYIYEGRVAKSRAHSRVKNNMAPSGIMRIDRKLKQ